MISDYSNSTGLSLGTLTSPKEKSYYNIIVIVSILVWLGIAITIIGIFYAALFCVIGWLASGLLVAYLRSESLKAGADQLPALHANLVRVCERLGVSEVPELYVLQAGGSLNAFATRFSGRNFVVVFSDLLEILGPDSKEMAFLLGHEIGHLKSNHIHKRIFLAPGTIVPLLGAAYFRACEASCDRHGAYAADDLAASERSLLVLGGGRTAGASANAAVFSAQYENARGFFVSWHELTSPYPTLSQRVWLLRSFLEAKQPAKRHPLAYLFAIFTPNGTMTGSGNILVFIVIIGMLAAMAIPAFQKVRDNSLAKACNNNQRMIQGAYQQYVLAKNKPSTDISEVMSFVGMGDYKMKCPGATYQITVLDDGDCDVECSTHGSLLQR